jgi:hypothetical protein
MIEQIAQLTDRIRACDQEIERLIEEDYPEALLLQQVNGVGRSRPALCTDHRRPGTVQTSRDVPAYLGLTPASDQSGERTGKCASRKREIFLRRLVVQSAHYVSGPFGTDCDLRRWGLKLAGPLVRGKVNKQRKKRSHSGRGPKLTMLLHALWRSTAPYEPLRLAASKSCLETQSPPHPISLKGTPRPGDARQG